MEEHKMGITYSTCRRDEKYVQYFGRKVSMWETTWKTLAWISSLPQMKQGNLTHSQCSFECRNFSWRYQRVRRLYWKVCANIGWMFES